MIQILKIKCFYFKYMTEILKSKRLQEKSYTSNFNTENFIFFLLLLWYKAVITTRHRQKNEVSRSTWWSCTFVCYHIVTYVSDYRRGLD
jgi:hypothetical protein